MGHRYQEDLALIRIRVTADIKRAIRRLDDLQRKHVPFATALALNKTGQAVKSALQAEMDVAFDRPTPNTKSALYLSPASKSRLRARVWMKDKQARYLSTQVRGGKRPAKGFEALLRRTRRLPEGWYAVPSKYVKLDGYGNVPGGIITKILSQLQSSRDPTANENILAKRRRNRTMAKGRYFAVLPGRSHLAPGIWERMGTAWGSALRPVFLYTQRQPGYGSRLRFFEIGNRVAREEFPIQFQLALRRALSTAR